MDPFQIKSPGAWNKNIRNWYIWTSRFLENKSLFVGKAFVQKVVSQKMMQYGMDKILWGRTFKSTWYCNLRTSEFWVLDPGSLTWDLGTRISDPKLYILPQTNNTCLPPGTIFLKQFLEPTSSVAAEDLMPRDIMSSEPRHWLVFGQLVMNVQCSAAHSNDQLVKVSWQ